MASQYDESDFVDSDYQSFKAPSDTAAVAPAPGRPASRPLSREELDSKSVEAQKKLAELKRAQEQLERERVALEEARRRRGELAAGREEMLNHLTRGVTLLEEAEFAARRDAEQMAKSLEGLREALEKVSAIREEDWTQENWNVELTKALTSVENARMEWNSARLKWPVLSGDKGSGAGLPEARAESPALAELGFWQLSRVGLAFSWPLVLVGLIALVTCLILFR